MNTNDKNNISKMRNCGCSYKQIADTLELKECTVKKHCLRHGIKLPAGMEPQRQPRDKWRVCPYCHEAYIVNPENEKQFCSDKCRANYWKAKRREEEAMKKQEEAFIKEMQQQLALKKELDLLAKKSDELVAKGGLPLGYRKE